MGPSSYAAEYTATLPARYQNLIEESVPQRSRRNKPESVKTKKAKFELLPQAQAARDTLSASSLAKLIALMILLGVILLGIVLLGARATQLQYNINKINKENLDLENQITMLGIEIESAVSFESVEDYAVNNLGMKYPNQKQVIYIAEDAKVDANLANIIREKAYS